MTKFKKLFAVLLVLIMVFSMAACGKKPSDGGEVVQPDGDKPTPEPENTTPLVVGYAPFSSKFSPFFSETAYDADAYAMT